MLELRPLRLPRTTPETSGDGTAAGRWRDKHPTAARSVAWTITVLAAVLVHVALVLPNHFAHLTPVAFTRIPLEGLFGAAILLALPPKPRRVVAVLAGATLGALTVNKLLDMGLYANLDRPFHLVFDWVLLANAVEFLNESVGPGGALAAVIGAVLVALTLPVLTALAVVRLGHVMVEYRKVATRSALILGTAWMVGVTLNVQIAEVPLATENTSTFVRNRVHSIGASLQDRRAFADQSTVDAFRDVPPDRLLTGLRGKDVIFAFVESYGRSAIEDRQMAPVVRAALEEGAGRLRTAGFSARSAFLTSPTTGAGSWLAHSTFMSGLWIKNEQRYRTVTTAERLTLTGAFHRTGAWRTVGILPGTTRAWPEGEFYEFDRIYDSRHLGYEGPAFGWSGIPDQYALSAFERLENGVPGRGPLLAEVVLTSSHNPWVPLPTMIGWDQLGDGSGYDSPHKTGEESPKVWTDEEQVRKDYARSVAYSVDSLVSYVERYGDEDTVLVFLGDHQPVPTVTRGDPNRDVPISIVAHDHQVLDRISDWGWQDGLEPHPEAPVWRMDTFRDRFLTAYGPATRTR
jgi:hypothetical protein